MTQNPNIKMNKIQVKKKKIVALILPNISPINPIYYYICFLVMLSNKEITIESLRWDEPRGAVNEDIVKIIEMYIKIVKLNYTAIRKILGFFITLIFDNFLEFH